MQRRISWAYVSRLTDQLRAANQDCVELCAIANGLVGRPDLKRLAAAAEREFERICDERWRAEQTILRRGTLGDKMRVLARRARDGLDVTGYLTDSKIIPQG